MIDLTDRNHIPERFELYEFVRNPLLERFCAHLEQVYNAKSIMEFSKCSWEYGWNLKFKKSGKTICTIYPRENYFTILVVIGAKEKDAAEALLPTLTPQLQELYAQTKEGNGQRWLMIDLEDEDSVYNGTLALIDLRINCK